MFEAKQGKEIVVNVKNRIDILFDLSKQIAEKGISILALNGVVSDGDCVIRLVTDDNLRAAETLRGKKYHVHEEDVILVILPHKPGMLRRVIEALVSEEIDIRRIYSTAFAKQEKSLVVLRTSNDEHALLRLNKI
jgi:hypothetical protein